MKLNNGYRRTLQSYNDDKGHWHYKKNMSCDTHRYILVATAL